MYMVTSQKIILTKFLATISEELSIEELLRAVGYVEGMVAGKEISQRNKKQHR